MAKKLTGIWSTEWAVTRKEALAAQAILARLKIPEGMTVAEIRCWVDGKAWTFKPA